MQPTGSSWKIRFIVFLSGAAVMGVEIMASRLFAPAFGNSIFVWGSLIGVIMLALAIGYWIGGKRADKIASYSALSNIVLASGTFVVFIPIATPYVLELVRYVGIGETYGPLLASILLLTGPTILLGMVSPYAIRLSASDLVNLGFVSGSLSSINTAGGIFGTFFTVFILIPNFGTREIIYSIGVLLIAVSLIERDWKDRLFLIFLVFLFLVPVELIGVRLKILGGDVILRKETPYSTLTVMDNNEEDKRYMFLNNMAHSSMYLNGSTKAAIVYTDYFNLAFGYNTKIENVLFIGGGGFSGPKQFLELYPWTKIDVVELDPFVVDAAYEFFQVPRNNPRLQIYIMDGRSFLDKAGIYDLIVLDAYSHTYVPFHLMTIEFHQQLREHLSNNGVLISNLISSFVGDTSELMWSEVKTINQVYPKVCLYSTLDASEATVRNVILVASVENKTVSSDDFNNSISQVLENPIHIQRYYKSMYKGEPFGRQLILKDNFAPVESLLNPVTLTNYEGSGKLNEISLINPFLLASIWVVLLGILFSIILWGKSSHVY
jgi:spermidine synthase